MKVEDMKCAGCEGTIRKQLLMLKDVYDARANFRSGMLLLNVESSFKAADAVKVIRDLGFTPVESQKDHDSTDLEKE